MKEKVVTVRDEEFRVNVAREGEAFDCSINGHRDRIEVIEVLDNEVILRLNGRRIIVNYVANGERIEFVADGEIYSAEVSEKSRNARHRHRDFSMSAPMPGVVLKLFVKKDDKVEKGTPLLILEAMKMEHQISAPYDGRVKSVNCTEGELVQPGVDLIEIEPDQEAQ